MKTAAALTLAVSLALAFAETGNSATIYVPDDHASIQGAIDAAAPWHDVIIVRPGTYRGNILFDRGSVTVRSERGASVTVIEGNGAGTVVKFGRNSSACVLDGFTVTNGYGDHCSAGGITFGKSADGTITNNIITGNRGDGGGGVCSYRAGPVITGNTITGNTGGLAGGIYSDSSYATISYNIISGNTGESVYGAGGINAICESSNVYTGNRITGNTGRLGGGIGVNSCCGMKAIRLSDNVITGNSAVSGGGIYCECSTAVFDNTVIRGNTARHGAGIRTFRSTVKVVNSVITENLAADFGGGIYCHDTSLTVGNTILWNNSAPLGVEMWLGETAHPSTANLLNNDVKGGQASCHAEPGCILYFGAGNIDADPLFVDAASGDFHLSWPSPCRDGGENSIVAGLLDFEKDDRIADGTVDIGADEYSLHLYHEGPVAPGAAVVFKAIGIPGDASFLLYSPRLQYPPEITPFGPLHLRRPLAFLGRGSFPAGGYDEKARTMPTTLRPGQRLHYQLLTGKRLSNLMELVVE